MGAMLLERYEDLECPQCGLTERIRVLPANAARMHNCPKLHGLTAPLVPAGMDCRLVAVERSDYLNGEQQRTGDDGKPYAAVVTERGDGSGDATVFPGVARWGAGS
jgi:hypothetical protein